MERRRAEPAADVDRRRRVMEAAKTAIAGHGLNGVRMAHIAELAGMSPGHILYYFHSKDELLVRTLLWNEAQNAARWRADIMAIGDARGRLAYFIDAYIPTGPRDPDWALWLAGYGMVLTDPDIFLTVEDAVHGWEDLLTEIVEFGISRNEFMALDARVFAERLTVLLNGYSLSVATGDPRYDKETAVRSVSAAAAAELGVHPDQLRAE
jgi:AcrR family transcriptional regulator